MKRKKRPEQPEEKHDSKAESEIRRDDRIRQICKTVGIEAIHCIENDNGKFVYVVPKGTERAKDARFCIRLPLEQELTPAQIVKKVHLALKKLVDRPIMFEATKHCNRNLTDEAMGDKDTLGKSDERMLWELAKTYEGELRLIHAWYDVTSAIEYFEPGKMSGDFRRAIKIEESINQKLMNGDKMIAYWWRLDDNTGNELHIVYAGNAEYSDNEEHTGILEKNDTARNEEIASYSVLLEEIRQALEKAGFSDLVSITNDDDEGNGELLTSTDDESKRDSFFGQSVPTLTTSVNGMILEDTQLRSFISAIEDTLDWQRENGIPPGINLVINDSILNYSEEDEVMGLNHIDWKLSCYTRLPEVEDSDEKESIQEWNENILNILLQKISEQIHPLKRCEVMDAIKIKEKVRLYESPTYVEIEWSQDQQSFASNNIEIVADKILDAYFKSDRGEQGINVAILESSPSVDNENIVNVTIAISVGDDDHE
jgi:hypothetical protein